MVHRDAPYVPAVKRGIAIIMSPTTSPTENHSTNSRGTSGTTSAAISPPRGGSLSNAVVLQRMEVSPGLIVLRVAPDDTHLFVCGNPEMIENMVQLLSRQGFREHSKQLPGQIHVERYW